MNWSASVLSTVSSDTEPTIVLAFDSAKYIFNAGENTSRAFLQSRRNWKRTHGLFFTQVGTQRASGLPGLLMSFADATISRLDIVGPPGLSHFLAAMRSYTFRDTMPIYPVEASWNLSTSSSPDPLYQDKNITVYGIPILPSFESPQNTSRSTSDPSTVAESSDHSLKRKREASPDSSTKRSTLTAEGIHSLNNAPSLADIVDQADFTPSVLTGETAQQWRRWMIDVMFPGVKDKLEAQKQKHRKERDRDAVPSPSKKSNNKSAGPGVPNNGRSNAMDNEMDTVDNSGPIPLDGKDGSALCSSPNIDIYKRARLPPGFHQQLPKYVHQNPSFAFTPSAKPILAYIAVGPRVRGKFDVKKAEQLGVPSGPKRGKLTRGESVTVKVQVEGKFVERVVRPEECVGESETPVATLILDIPSKAHIPSLLSAFDNSPFYAKFRSTLPEDLRTYVVRSVFHICGDGVLEDERYIAFMNGFAPSVHHVVASREHSPDPVTFTSAAFNQFRLNQLDSEMFPLPKFSLSPKKDISTIPNLPPTTCLMPSNLLIQMRPPAPPVQETFAEDVDLFHPAVSSQNPSLRTLPTLTLQRFAEGKKITEDHLNSGSVNIPNGADVGVIPLGTGSAIPTKYRNVSSTLLRIPSWGSILLEAGEGTWGQLIRQFGTGDSTSSGVCEVLRDLKCIYISHIHGDHHMGIAKILAQRRMLDPPPTKPLYLVTLRAVHLYLRELSDLQDLGLDDPSGNGVIMIMSEALHWKQSGAYQTSGMWQIGGNEPWTDYQLSLSNAANMCRALGLESFHTVDVYHRTRCYGAVLKHTDGWSIVFSGDTQPTNTLVHAGRNATLLIHEATMADDQFDMAKKKAHSTFGQAIDIGRRMNAEHVLLTHFSARYPKMPPAGITRSTQNGGNTDRKQPILALSFDHLNLTIGNMWKLNHYLPAIEQSFKDTTEEDDGDVDIEAVMNVDIS